MLKFARLFGSCAQPLCCAPILFFIVSSPSSQHNLSHKSSFADESDWNIVYDMKIDYADLLCIVYNPPSPPIHSTVGINKAGLAGWPKGVMIKGG